MRTRREIIGLLAAIGASPALALSLEPRLQERAPWERFRRGRDYPRFVEAVRRMKAKGDATSPDSWDFWADVHMHHCPHGAPYFLAWHRGFLHLFEERLRKISGSDTLRVPYWDYFADPQLPEELTKGNSATNPLFEARRGTSVGEALGYAAFAKEVKGFARGESSDCFEARVEAFHNNIHNLIGGRMATMLSPRDVVFWIHHANIDRLWTAWAAAGDGRAMPQADSPYWSGQLDYADALALPRNAALSGEGLGYRYADVALPSPGDVEGAGAPRTVPLPRPGAAAPAHGAPVVVAVPEPAPAPPPPPVEAAPPMAMAPAPAPAPIPYRGIWLGGEEYMAYLPLRTRGDVPIATEATLPDDIVIVLDAVALTAAGADGGYFYKLYLDLDDEGGRTRGEENLLGTIGPFQIAAAMHMAYDGNVRLTLPVGDVIRRIAPGRALDRLGVAFLRIDANGPPGGNVISIGSVELAGRG